MRKRGTFAVLPGVLVCLGLLLLCGCKGRTATARDTVQKQYCGQWYVSEEEDTTIDIIGVDDSTFAITVTAATEEDAILCWELTGSYDGNKIIYTNGEKYSITYDTYGDAVEESLYDNGEGSFTVHGDTLTWTDATEGIATGLTFRRME